MFVLNGITLALCSVLALIFKSSFLSSVLKRRQTRVREPPNAQASVNVPVFGHLIGMFRSRCQYFADLGFKQREPMTKISLIGTNIYITGSNRMMPSLQRQPRSISPKTFFAKFLCPLVGCSKPSTAKFNAGLGAVSDGDSMLQEGTKTTKRILGAAIGTDGNYGASKIVNKYFRSTDMSTLGEDLDLVRWIKHGALHIVSEGTYGPENPFWDADIATALWDFEKHTMAICTSNFMPKLIRRLFIGGIKSRERLVRALDDYLHNGGLDRGSPIVNAHYQAYQSYIDKSDIARFECGTALGTFANTTPVTIWTAFHIFSDAGLLQKLREQISAVTTSFKAEDGTTTIHRIDARKLRSATILFSTIEEVARYRSTGLGVRYVTEDTIVGEGYDRYSLKKDSWLIISNKSLHRDKEAWGEDADDFVADRFCRRIPHVSYRSFGNGTSACCGKNFALHYIASFMALLIMRFNMEPVDGVWKDLGQDARDSTTQTTEPNGEIPVRVTSRFNVEEGVWELSDEQRILRARGFFC